MEAMYPVSLIAHGGALNITCVSYSDSMNFGFTGCRDTLPSMQKLAVYTGEALEELETLLLPRKKTASQPEKTAAKKKAVKKKAASRKKPASKQTTSR